MGRNYDIMRDAAYTRKGHEMHNLIIGWETVKSVAPFALGAALVGGLGYGAYWVWTAVAGFGGVDLPSLVWVALIALPVALIAIGRSLTLSLHPAARLALIVVVVLLALGAVGLGMGLLSAA